MQIFSLQPHISKQKSRSLEQIFLTIGQKKFEAKYQISHFERIKLNVINERYFSLRSKRIQCHFQNYKNETTKEIKTFPTKC